LHDRAALFGVVTGWACVWACLGLLRAAGFDLAWGGEALPSSGEAAPLFQLPGTASRILGVAQLGVAAGFLSVLLPGRAVPAQDRVLGACAWGMIVLGLITAADGMAGATPAMVVDGLLFLALAGTALLAATADHRAARAGGRPVFAWMRREALPDPEPLAEEAGLKEYRPPCRTSSQM
jgi:hypothetical protein